MHDAWREECCYVTKTVRKNRSRVARKVTDLGGVLCERRLKRELGLWETLQDVTFGQQVYLVNFVPPRSIDNSPWINEELSMLCAVFCIYEEH